jgi:hypothetical protein
MAINAVILLGMSETSLTQGCGGHVALALSPASI